MQPHKPQKPGPASPTSRKGSLSTIFSKKNFSFSKKDRAEGVVSPTLPPPVEEQEPKPGDPNGYVSPYTRVQRTGQPTEKDLKSYAGNLRDQLADTWPRRHNNRYKKVHALIVCWADNEPSRRNTPRFSPESHPPSSPTATIMDSPTLRAQQSCVALRSSYASDDVRAVRRTSSRIDMRESQTGATTVGKHGAFVAAAYELNSVFERRYGYNSQIWMVPNIGDPQEALAHKLRQFVADFGSPDNLLIFWYGGHAEFVGNFNRDSQGGGLSGGNVIWYGLRDEMGIPAKTAAKVLVNAQADVWMINDSPFALHAYVPHANSQGSFELLGSGSTTPSNLEMNRERECSLTRTLTLMLDSPYLAAAGASIHDIHRKLLDMQVYHMTSANYAAAMRSSGASQSTGTNSFGARGSNNSNASGGGGGAGGVRGSNGSGNADTTTTTITTAAVAPGTPVQSNFNLNSSLIPSRCKRFGTPPALPVYCQIGQAAGFERDAVRNIVIAKLDSTFALNSSTARGAGVRFHGEDLLVRMDIKLKRPSLDVCRWREWILRAPADANGVRLTVVQQQQDQKKEGAGKDKEKGKDKDKETIF